MVIEKRKDQMVSTHSRPKAAGSAPSTFALARLFQHTAARRRLGAVQRLALIPEASFNTQPPEGGWDSDGEIIAAEAMFQHTAARRRLAQ